MLKTRALGFILLFFVLVGLRSSLHAEAVRSDSLKLITPGEGSIVTSPIKISAQVQVRPQDLIRVKLVDRSGSIISRQLLPVNARGDMVLNFTSRLAFEIPRETADGLLTIAVQDNNNRLVALRSAALKLLSDGENLINLQSSSSDWLTITKPQPGEKLQGGAIDVEGTVIPIIDRPVVFELITDSGGQIGWKQLAVEDAGVPIEFNITVPYAYITQERDVRLVIRQTDTFYGENIILDSVPIYLSP
jgi:hypothetical protein